MGATWSLGLISAAPLGFRSWQCHGEYQDGERELDWAEFYPGRLGFSAPWSGRYDT